MNKAERITLLDEAQGLLNEAISKLKEAIEGTRNEEYYRMYVVNHLELMSSSESHTESIRQMIKYYDSDDLEDDDSDDDRF